MLKYGPVLLASLATDLEMTRSECIVVSELNRKLVINDLYEKNRHQLNISLFYRLSENSSSRITF